MDFIRGFMLGLASGTVCVAYCAPILVPYLLSKGQNTLSNLLTILYFMAGRLAGYLLFAVLAWAAGMAAAASIKNEKAVFGVIYIVLAGFMIFYGFKKTSGDCAVKRAGFLCSTTFPAVLGFLTGLNLCPPFLLAFTEAARTAVLWRSMLFFAAFFAGTSVYILPLALLGLGRRAEGLRYIGRLAAGVTGVFYLYLGIWSLKGA